MKKSSGIEDEGAAKVAQHMETMSQIELEKPENQFSTTISLNATDEFCRQLGNHCVFQINFDSTGAILPKTSLNCDLFGW